MKTLLAEHLGLILALVFFLGWTAHWIVGLLFFRRRYFEQEAQITQQSRTLDELRFTLGRTQSDLRSRNDLLEAAQRSRGAAETRVATLEGELLAVGGRLAVAESSARTHADAAKVAQNRLAEAEAEFRRVQSTPRDPTSQEPELRAELATAQAAAQHWANRSSALELELENLARANASLSEQLDSQPSIQSSAGAGRDLDSALADLDAVTRERNEFAAELAALRAGFPTGAALGDPVEGGSSSAPRGSGEPARPRPSEDSER